MNPAGVKLQSQNVQLRGPNPVTYIAQNIPVSHVVIQGEVWILSLSYNTNTENKETVRFILLTKLFSLAHSLSLSLSLSYTTVSNLPCLQGTQGSGGSVTMKPGTMAILPQQNVPLQAYQALQSKAPGQTNLLPTPVQLQQQNLKSVSIWNIVHIYLIYCIIQLWALGY